MSFNYPTRKMQLNSIRNTRLHDTELLTDPTVKFLVIWGNENIIIEIIEGSQKPLSSLIQHTI